MNDMKHMTTNTQTHVYKGHTYTWDELLSKLGTEYGVTSCDLCNTTTLCELHYDQGMLVLATCNCINTTE